ncbi:MAG: phosphatidylglycerophosphatase A [Myxococcota bacterium]
MAQHETTSSSRYRSISFWVATFGGAGLSPVMPGTVGSAASLLVWAPLIFAEAPLALRAAVIACGFLLGVPTSARAAKMLGTDDPGAVVIDEVAGQGLALLLCGPNVMSVLVGFLLFRIFDILKPWPVRVADRWHGGFGIMADDIAAGAYALMGLMVWQRYVLPALPFAEG